MPDLYLKDPPADASWFPFSDCRPISELRAGAWLIRERWEAVAQGQAQAIFAAEHLHAFREDGVPPVGRPRNVIGPAIVGLASFAPSGDVPELGADPTRFTHEGQTVGWWVPDAVTWIDEEHTDWDSVDLDGIPLRGTFDLVTALEHFLVADVADFTAERGDDLPEGCVVIGDPHDVVILGAAVEPGVTFDVREGAVVLEQHARVKAGVRFEGPVYVGPGTEILGGPIRWSAFGPRCRARGEILNTVLLGYANKAHDGFLGHSVLGRWVNLGAGTVTSNLKNTYGEIRLDVADTKIETERHNLGSLLGDHAKTAIGTLLETGTVVGTGANVFGAVRPPKCVPPMAWGCDGEVMHKDGFLSVAARVMPRRQVEVTDEIRQMLSDIYDHAASG